MAPKSRSENPKKRSLPRRLRNIPNCDELFGNVFSRVRPPSPIAEVSAVADFREGSASSGNTPTADNAGCKCGNSPCNPYSDVDVRATFQHYSTQVQEDRVGPYLVDTSTEVQLGWDESNYGAYQFTVEGDVQAPQAYDSPYAMDSTGSAGQDSTFNNYGGLVVNNSIGRSLGCEEIPLHNPMDVSYDQGDNLYWPHQGSELPPLSSATPREGVQPMHSSFYYDAPSTGDGLEPARSRSTSHSEGMRYGNRGADCVQPGDSWQSGNAD